MKTRALESSTCARCRRPVALVVLNGTSVALEPTAGVIGNLIILETHTCGADGKGPIEPPREAGSRGGASPREGARRA